MEPTEQGTIDELRRRRRKRRWIGAAVAIVILLLLVLTPPLVNVSRFQRRIVTSMSQSLGRPVHLDRVTLHLLPMPGFTLENLVVSEDPAFGNEPIIRANTVEATLRVSSLWKRRVEFSTISFVEPSLNLVRNKEGRWNIENVLVHASHVDTAPTTQLKAGPTPRFPYIEATGGRINIKLGEEKAPFSLINTDFALWLPSPDVWNVRLQGKPARTDSNIGDPGTVRLEGSLQRAAHMDEVPVDLHASWHDAPLGDASRLLTGDDRDWRGTLHADASLQGKLGAAVLKAMITLDELRRADFIPAQSLDVSLLCTSTANVPVATLQNLVCNVPTSGSQPLQIESPAVDLQRPVQSSVTVSAAKVPLEWVFGWMRLFSQRIPTAALVRGTVDAALTHAQDAPIGQWNGTADVTIPAAVYHANGKTLPVKGTATPTAQSFEGTVTSTNGAWSLALPATPLRLGPGAALMVSAQASPMGYGFTVTGEASPAQLANIGYVLPQLADDSAGSLPKSASAADTIRQVALTCSRLWSQGQTCSAPPPVTRAKKPKRVRRRRR